MQFRPKDDPLSWPLPADKPDPVISPTPEAQIDTATDPKSPEAVPKTSLNPNVPEFVPSFTVKANNADPLRDEDEAGTDGDDEAEIVDNKVVHAKMTKDENWVEVRSKKQDRKSQTKELVGERKDNDDEREELEFQFDEDLDMPVGRQNKFSSM